MSEHSGSLQRKALREGQLYPKFYAYYFNQFTGFHMPVHAHDSTEIMYLVSGSCRIYVYTSDGREHLLQLSKGEFVLIDALVPHRLEAEDDVSFRMLNIEFGFAAGRGEPLSMRCLAEEEPLIAELLDEPYEFRVLRDPEELYQVLKSLVMELERLNMDENLLVRLLFSQLLCRIALLVEAAKRPTADVADYYVNRSIQYLHEHMDREIKVEDVARIVSLHPGYLQRIFKRITGSTIVDYITRLRMERAKLLLRQTDISVNQIPDYIGVGSRQYFHQLFKKHTGQTPAEYRNAAGRRSWHYPEGVAVRNKGEDF